MKTPCGSGGREVCPGGKAGAAGAGGAFGSAGAGGASGAGGAPAAFADIGKVGIALGPPGVQQVGAQPDFATRAAGQVTWK